MHVICEYGSSSKFSCTFTSTPSKPYFFIQFFNACVPPANRKQLTHQVFVSGLQWAVFVTSGIKNQKGFTIQTVRVKYPLKVIQDHSSLITPRISEIIG